jgi:hypothetical protein
MKRRVENWSVEQLHKARTRISFPEYQRQPNLWSIDKKQLLIDSILCDIDIPKLYFNKAKEGELEVVDGQQRLWAIWEFIDDVYPYKTGTKSQNFSDLPPEQQKTIRNYAIQISVFEDAGDDYLRELFIRLQLGLLLVTGEKLHAATGTMKEFVFDKMAAHNFIRHVKIPKRRYARETLCAQIAINSFMQAKLQSFARTRYEDLRFFFQDYEHPQGTDLEFFRKQSKGILLVLDDIFECFDDRTKDLSSRSYILSVYLLFEKLRDSLSSAAAKQMFKKFVFALWRRLKEEIGAGIDRGNRELYVFETMLSSAPGEKYQIDRRHQKLVEYYEHYKSSGKIMGDR